jgi:hypothetical protein
MTILRALLALAAALCALPAPLSAQQSGNTNGPLSGEWLLGLDLGYAWQSQDSLERESFQIGATLSRFLSRPHQLGLELRSRYEAIEDGGHAGQVFLGPIYNYNWYPAARTAVYLGGRAGAAFEDVTGAGDDTHLAWGLQAGLRQWITPRAALYVEPRYTRFEIDGDGATERDRFDLLLGLNLVL